jgi:hypothetical protein
MKGLQKIFVVGFSLITVFFVLSAFSLIAFAALELWQGLKPGGDIEMRGRFNSVLESIGLLTIAVAALELGQTILDEEVRREAEMSVPTRVRRFLSRFMIVIIVSLSIEFLVSVFQLIHDNPAALPQASWVGIATAALLASWGIFIKLNRSAEELEPEAIKQVQREDKQM